MEKYKITMLYRQDDEYFMSLDENGLPRPDGEPFDSLEYDPLYKVYRADDENKSFPIATFETYEQAINFVKKIIEKKELLKGIIERK